MKKCSKCGKARPYSLSDGRLKCRVCGHRFSWTSVWDSVRLRDATKHRLLNSFVLGVPAHRQRFQKGASLASKQRFYRLLRACCAMTEDLRKPFDGQVECDETTFGGYRRGSKPGWAAEGKVIVFGLVKRNGHVKAFPIPARQRRPVMAQIQTHTREGTLFYTDQWNAYVALRLRGKHVVVRKRQGRPIGRNHINGIEGFWSYAKHWLYPYRGVPRRYFHLYLAETCFRFNHRDQDLKPRLLSLMRSTNIQELKPILVRFA